MVVERLEARLLFRWCEKKRRGGGGGLGALLARKHLQLSCFVAHCSSSVVTLHHLNRPFVAFSVATRVLPTS